MVAFADNRRKGVAVKRLRNLNIKIHRVLFGHRKPLGFAEIPSWANLTIFASCSLFIAYFGPLVWQAALELNRLSALHPLNASAYGLLVLLSLFGVALLNAAVDMASALKALTDQRQRLRKSKVQGKLASRKKMHNK